MVSKFGIEFLKVRKKMFPGCIDLFLFLALLILFIYAVAASYLTIMHKTYLGLHFLMMLWPLGQFLISYAPGIYHKWFWLNLSFFGFSFLGFGWLVFSLAITEQGRYLRGAYLAILAAPAVISAALITTNPLHYLFATPENGSWEIRSYGPVFWFFLLSTVSFLVAATVIMIRRTRNKPEQLTSKQIRLIYLGLAIPILLGLLDTLINVVFYPRFGLVPGLTSLGIAISATCFVVAITKYDLIKVLDFARREIVENLPVGIVVLDNSNNIVESNRIAKYFLFRYKDSLKGANVSLLYNKIKRFVTDKNSFQHFFKECMENPLGVLNKEVSLRYPFKSHFSIIFSPVIDNKGIILGHVISFSEITHIKNMMDEINIKNKQLEKMAITDHLTGVYNKTYLSQYLVREIDKAIRDLISFSLVIFDLDHFKKVNDAYGHQVGDQVLKAVIEVVKANIRKNDVLARYGGEEFIIFTPYCDLACAVEMAERIKKVVASTWVNLAETAVSVTISAGVSSFYPDRSLSLSPEVILNRIIREADDALYLAKASGRNCVATYQKSLE